MEPKNRRGSAAVTQQTTDSGPSGEVSGEALATDQTHDYGASQKRILEMVQSSPEEKLLETDDADMPVLSWEDTAEVRGGNLTDMGFAKLLPGWEFRGYVIGTKKVPSDLGKEEVVLDADSKPVIDPLTKQPMTRKMQEVFVLKGTARFPVKGATPNTFGECAGRMTISMYARLLEPVNENRAKEEALTRRARANNASAPAVHIPLHIKYVGTNPDKETAGAEGTPPVKTRSGAHLFTVVRLRVTEAA